MGWSCGDLGADYAYRGVQQVASGPYAVAAVFQTETAPVVMAQRREPGERPEMHIFHLSDQQQCLAGPFSRYLAAGDRRGFRLALFEEDERWRFFDEACDEALAVDQVTSSLRVLVDPFVMEHVYLVEDTDQRLWRLEPFEGTRRLLTADLRVRDGDGSLVRSSSLPVDGGEFALWVLRTGNELELLSSVSGRAALAPIEGVLSLTTAGELGYADRGLELLAAVRASGVALLVAASDGNEVLSLPVWEEEGACAPSFIDALAGCFDEDCEAYRPAADSASTGSQVISRALGLPEAEKGLPEAFARRLPWLAMEQPCGSGTLVLLSLAVDLRIEVPGAANSYRFVGGVADVSKPALFFVEVLKDALQAKFMALGQEPELVPVPLDLAVTPERVPEAGAYRVVTLEVSPRVGLWEPGGEFTALRSDLAVINGRAVTASNLVLYDAQDNVGTLARCEGTRCVDLARGVPARRFLRYDTLPRIGDSVEAVVFVRDVNEDTGAGELVVTAPELGITTVLDKDVSTFRDVERGPARGIVYSVVDEARRGLWFAPR